MIIAGLKLPWLYNGLLFHGQYIIDHIWLKAQQDAIRIFTGIDMIILHDLDGLQVMSKSIFDPLSTFMATDTVAE